MRIGFLDGHGVGVRVRVLRVLLILFGLYVFSWLFILLNFFWSSGGRSKIGFMFVCHLSKVGFIFA